MGSGASMQWKIPLVVPDTVDPRGSLFGGKGRVNPFPVRPGRRPKSSGAVFLIT